MAEVAFREYLVEIDDLIEHGSTEQAIQHCHHILAQHPKAVEVYRLLGKALLEKEDDRAAQDVFQRVLSVDPEDFVARVGLSIIHDRNNELEPAIWHMERAFEIAPSNGLIQGELRRLYARREGQSPERIPLTRGALARMYAAGDLNPEAIADLRQLLAEQGDRIDLQVQLAEVLWRDRQHVEAAEHAQRITRTLPFCLKANLILGAILRASGANGESDGSLQRAQAVDPENQLAQQLFSGMGPLDRQSIVVDRLELKTIDQMLETPPAEAEEIPEWLRGLSNLEQPLVEEPESKPAAALSSGVHMPEAATELPDWLQGLTGEASATAEAEVPDWLAALTGVAAAGAAVEALSDRKTAPEEVVIRPADEAVPDWITQLGQTGTLKPAEELPQQEEEPDWVVQLRETPPAPFSEQIPAAADTQTPDWLAQLQTSEPTPESTSGVGEEPDWLSQLRASGVQAETEEEAGLDLHPGAVAAGLAGAGAALLVAHEAGEEKAEPTPESTSVVGEEPDWLSRLRAPSAQAETEEEAGPDLHPGVAMAGAGAALFVAHEAGEEKAEPTPESTSVVGEEPDWLSQLRASGAQAETEEEAGLDLHPGAVAAGLAGAGAALFVAHEAREEKAEPIPESTSVVGEEPDWLSQLRASRAQAETEEEAGPDLHPGVAMAGAGAALFVAHEAGEEKAEPIPESTSVVGEEPDWLARLRAPSAQAETEEEAGLDLHPGAVAAGLAGAGAALLVAHEAGEEKAGPTPEPEQPIDLAQPSAPLAAETEQLPSGVTAEAIEEPKVPEEMPSADDALAFLAKLAAGKEDQLRAQAQQEADVRMAEIMGRKPAEAAPAAEEKQAPIKMTVPAATVAAVAAGLAAMTTTPEEKPAEPEAPASVPEEMPSADDALAFLSRLAAGKEDQLRAQAEQEAEARMDEIMGRKPGQSRAPKPGPEETPRAAGLAAVGLGVTAMAAGAAAAQKEEEPPVEEELRAQAEQEAEARMAAILTRTAPLKPAKPIEEAPTPVAMIEPEVEAEITEETTAIAEPVAEADLPDWLKVMRPTEEVMAETPESELPEWLRAMRPTEESSELGLVALIEEAEEETAAPVAETAVALGALSAVGGEQPGEVEEEPTVFPQTSTGLPLDWWVQTATDTGEAPLPELPQPYLSPRARAAEKERAAAALSLSLEEKASERRVPQTGPLRQTGTLAVPQTGPLGTPEPAAVSAEVEALISRLLHDPQDYAARLDLARTYWATGNREGAYAEYLALVNANEYTKETMADLETIVEIYDQTDWHRLLGDVYMKVGRLSGALAQYRSALSEV